MSCARYPACAACDSGSFLLGARALTIPGKLTFKLSSVYIEAKTLAGLHGSYLTEFDGLVRPLKL